MEAIIRRADFKDLQDLLELYTQLGNKKPPLVDAHIEGVFQSILTQNNQYIIIAEVDGRAVSTATVSILQSLTHDQRPYAVIEHVVTLSEFRGKGLGADVMAYIQKTAEENFCYKMMLITGRPEEGVHKFYKRCGFSQEDKTAYIKEL